LDAEELLGGAECPIFENLFSLCRYLKIQTATIIITASSAKKAVIPAPMKSEVVAEEE